MSTTQEDNLKILLNIGGASVARRAHRDRLQASRYIPNPSISRRTGDALVPSQRAGASRV